jgi:predicted secreted protein
MAAQKTSTSSISWGGTAIAGLYNITFNFNRTTIDVTELGSDFKAYIQGQADSSATVEVFFDQGVTVHGTLETSLNTAGGNISVVFTAHTGATYTFNAIVTSINYSAPVNDVVKATIELKVNGTVTIA